jgi:hypothetical protein
MLPDIEIIASTTEGVRVMAHGRPAELAIVTPEGLVLVSGTEVAEAVEQASVEAFRNLLRGQGHVKTVSST